MNSEEKLTAIIGVMVHYEGWHIDSPEDSWRLEREIRDILGMPGADLE